MQTRAIHKQALYILENGGLPEYYTAFRDMIKEYIWICGVVEYCTSESVTPDFLSLFQVTESTVAEKIAADRL